MPITSTQTTDLTDAPGLPDSPVKATQELSEKTRETVDPDGLLAELSDETLTTAERLENKFALINRWTISDAKLESRILRILTDDPRTHTADQSGTVTEIDQGETSGQETQDTIYVVYWLPTEEIAIEEFTKPIPWNPDEFKFAAVAEAIGYNASTIHQLEGEPVVLENTDSGWGVVNPETTEIHPGTLTTDTPHSQSPPWQITRDDIRAVTEHIRNSTYGYFLKGLGKGGTTTLLIGLPLLGLFAAASWVQDTLIRIVTESATNNDGSIPPSTIQSLIQLATVLFLTTTTLSMLQYFLRKGRSNRRL